MPTVSRADVAALARDLVRIPSENPPGEEADCARYVRDWFRDHGVDAVLLDDPYPERPQVAAAVGAGDPTVVLNGHLDVVPAGERDDWTHPPYAGVREDGRLYGRGSADMKTGLALAMLAVRDHRATDRPGTLVFHGAVGEESGDPGTRALLEAGYDGDYGIVLEPTDFRVATRAKGLVCYELAVDGTASHASRPDQGENAVANARPLLDAIDAYDADLRERRDPLVGRAYASVTRVSAGIDDNLGVLPGEARLVLDRRVLPGESVPDVEREVRDLLAAVEAEHGVEATLTELERYEPARVPADCALADTLHEHARAARGAVEHPWGIEAATDVRNLVNDAGMEAVTWGPGRLEQAHTTDEYVDLDDAAEGYAVLDAALGDLFERESESESA